MNFTFQNAYKLLLSFCLLIAVQLPSVAQNTASSDGISSVIGKVDNYNDVLPAEHIHLQFDKPNYVLGDTLWFKAFVLGPTLSYSALSARLYVELLNDSDQIVKRMAWPVAYGVSWGNIALDTNLVHEGTYTIRAYTNWLRNFNGDHVFYHSFYVSSLAERHLLINPSVKVDTVAGKTRLAVNIKYSTLANIPAGAQELQLKVKNNKRTIYRNSVQTSVDGTVHFEVPINAQSQISNLTLTTQPLNYAVGANYVTPLKINRAADVDVQFMPESGSLVTDLPASIGFKAIGEDGLGVDISGSVVDGNGNTQVKFTSLHKGIGKFDFLPAEGQTYTVKIQMPWGETRSFGLPTVKKSGTVLRVKNNPKTDTLLVTAYASPDMVNNDKIYYLLAQARGGVCFAASIMFKSQYVRLPIPKNLFPTGIAHFTLFDSDKMPLNERLSFIDRADRLNISPTMTKAAFLPHDSIAVHIKVNDADGKPVLGSFSALVTDNSKVNAAEYTNNILTDLLLNADLKGYIEDPTYYFTKRNEGAASLDALMLTQGWVGYQWKDILAATPPKPIYIPETEMNVTGKVTNLLNRPISNATVTLLAKSRVSFARDTVTNSEGAFLFHNFPVVDTVAFILQARRARGSIINSGVNVDNVESPPVNGLHNIAQTPWYVNPDTIQLNFIKSNQKYNDQLDMAKYGFNGHLLHNVDIKGNAIIKGSNNLNGAGNADQIIDNAQIEKAGKATLLQLIEQNVKYFHTQYEHKGTDQEFYIHDKKVHFVIDGVDLDKFYVASDDNDFQLPNQRYNYLKETLDYLTAEDILGIEVLSSEQYIAAYNNANLTTDELLAVTPTGPLGSQNAYLEITTRSGEGPFMRRSASIYVYKPLPLNRPAQFYNPRYKVAANSFTDLRSTIYWDPNIVTSKDGEATIWFYSANKSTTYTLTVEGTDLTGKIGSAVSQVKINPAGH